MTRSEWQVKKISCPLSSVVGGVFPAFLRVVLRWCGAPVGCLMRVNRGFPRAPIQWGFRWWIPARSSTYPRARQRCQRFGQSRSIDASEDLTHRGPLLPMCATLVGEALEHGRIHCPLGRAPAAIGARAGDWREAVRILQGEHRDEGELQGGSASSLAIARSRAR